MKRALAACLALALGGCASMAGDRAAPQRDVGYDAFAQLQAAGFAGDFAISQPGEVDTIYYGAAEEEAETRAVDGWPWASVTKQVMAVLVMREVDAGRLSLESDAADFVPALRGRGITVRHLLQHRAGLPNPDDTPKDSRGFPSFYGSQADPLAFCTGDGEAPRDDAAWEYNNCDYIVLGGVLERSSGSSLDLLLAQGIGLQSGWINTALLEPGEERDFAGRSAVTARRIAGYGAAGALVGPLDDMLLFDRALMDGTLLSEESLATLWQGDPAMGYMALGQWVFETTLTGCETPVRIVERRGAIGNYKVRNIILPDLDIAMAMATEQADFDFGAIWTGQGALHHTLASVACR